jgi:hypothetical protein
MNQILPIFKNNKERENFWFNIVKDYPDSSLTFEAFARKNNVSGTSISKWVNQLKDRILKNQSEKQLKNEDSADFLHVCIKKDKEICYEGADTTKTPVAELIFPNGTKLILHNSFDPQGIAQLIKAVG